MFDIYFFDDEGRCNAPIQELDGHTALEILMTYKQVVPAVLATFNKELAFESRHGQVLWPDDLTEGEMLYVASRFPPPLGERSSLELLFDYQEAFFQVLSAEASTLHLARVQLRAIEIPLLAFAARDGIDIHQYGYLASCLAVHGQEKKSLEALPLRERVAP